MRTEVSNTTEQNGVLVKQDFYDAWGNLTKTLQEDGSEIIYRYDVLGNQIEIKNSGEDSVTFVIDDLGRIREEFISIETNPVKFKYNAFSDVIEKTNRRDQVTTYEYDNTGRLVVEYWEEEFFSRYRKEFDYTPLGELKEARDGQGDEDGFLRCRYSIHVRIPGRQAGIEVGPMVFQSSNHHI